jgi:AraC-like DNA-binding protein
MGYRRYIPATPLGQYVACIWLYDGDARTHPPERALPTGAADLLIDMRDRPLKLFSRDDRSCTDKVRGPLLLGPHSEFFVMQRDAHASVLGVHFRPWATAALFRTHAADLHNQALPLDALWGAHAGRLYERLLSAREPRERFRTVEQALLEQLSAAADVNRGVLWALRELQRSHGTRTVAGLSEQLGLSSRRLSQLFGEAVGLTPKLYGRVKRFQRVLRQLQRGVPRSWGEIALACGYYDQAHFNRDFRAFAGTSPTAYLAARSPWRNHVSLSEEDVSRPPG